MVHEVSATMRFNFALPGFDPNQLSAMYQAASDMAEYGETRGINTFCLEEHHTTNDGWNPVPLTSAGVILGRTRSLRVLVGALLVPLQDPLRLAEQITALDLASGGRLSVVAGIGYRPEEYAAAGISWDDRGQRMDDNLDSMIKAWSGLPFEHQGRIVQITPKPLSDYRTLLVMGGTSRPAARRAARLGLAFIMTSHHPELMAYYEEQCAAHGTTPIGVMPPPENGVWLLAEDPDRAWAERGENLLHEARQYAAWNADTTNKPTNFSRARTLEELRAEGVYRILTPEDAVERYAANPGTLSFHPMCGGIGPEGAWETVTLCAERVLPSLRADLDSEVSAHLLVGDS
jgi:alkanesulfonate monooxygenase SsuD/methylene tetrahydromethanopterin reductase-like flavin-dependent oxidoreductase (luciferase family)